MGNDGEAAGLAGVSGGPEVNDSGMGCNSTVCVLPQASKWEKAVGAIPPLYTSFLNLPQPRAMQRILDILSIALLNWHPNQPRKGLHMQLKAHRLSG